MRNECQHQDPNTPKYMIPDRVSNAGPDTREPDYDWRDHVDFAECFTGSAKNAESVYHEYPANNTPRSINRSRIAAIDAAIEQLEKAKELLCR